MTFDINIQIDSPAEFQISTDSLRTVAQSALEICNIGQAELSIIITTDEMVRQLNRDYRGIDAPTDVLSFEAQNDDDFIAPETGHYLGDIIIAAPTAKRQATAMGHTLGEELSLLVIHGILHLLGYDHLTSDEKLTMWAIQTEILTHNGLTHVKPTEAKQ